MCLLQDEAGQPLVDSLFGVKLHTKLKCEETGESYEVCVDTCSCKHSKQIPEPLGRIDATFQEQKQCVQSGLLCVQ
jgi:hypothetical protein